MPDSAIITASAAFVGAAIGSGSAYLIARRNLKKEVSLKIAEYRLQWINNLGNEFSEYCAHVAEVFFNKDEKRQQELVALVFKSYTKVQMLMNIEDKDYKMLLSAMDEFMKYAGSFQGKNHAADSVPKFHELRKKYTSIANSILKREWQKTKKHLRQDTIEISALKSENKETTYSHYLHGDY